MAAASPGEFEEAVPDPEALEPQRPPNGWKRVLARWAEVLALLIYIVHKEEILAALTGIDQWLGQGFLRVLLMAPAILLVGHLVIGVLMYAAFWWRQRSIAPWQRH